ncbi:MAG: hypothetical protein EBV70_00445 [Actinobacteria bacterium]|nr:hypothetical protein [Actinomycetota bacterium]
MLEAIFLGIIQGLTEFLPISSSAHIRILGEFLPSAQDPGATFTAIMQIGTEIAVLIYFRADIARLISASLKWLISRGGLVGSERSDARLSTLILLGSLPIFFLLAIPAVLGSGAFELFNSLSKPLNSFSLGETFVATLTAFTVGFLVISWLMKYVQTKSFMPFVIYRLLLGTLLLILLSSGAISA